MTDKAITASVDELNVISFAIISQAGTSRSCYIEAIHAAKDGKFEEADELIVNAEDAYVSAHNAHMSLLSREAGGIPTAMNLILTHAEDQLMSAEGFGILAQEFIELYKSLKA